ncbi:14042_t:CDS:1, partial [Dentiscutata erythropus]
MLNIKIISGGLPGVEYAALRAAKKRKLKTGGHCTEFSENENNDILLQDYNLVKLQANSLTEKNQENIDNDSHAEKNQETTNTDSYTKIIQKNIDESDATLIFEITNIKCDYAQIIPYIGEKKLIIIYLKESKDNSQESKDNSQESKDNSQESKDNSQESKDNSQESKDNSQESKDNSQESKDNSQE